MLFSPYKNDTVADILRSSSKPRRYISVFSSPLHPKPVRNSTNEHNIKDLNDLLQDLDIQDRMDSLVHHRPTSYNISEKSDPSSPAIIPPHSQRTNNNLKRDINRDIVNELLQRVDERANRLTNNTETTLAVLKAERERIAAEKAAAEAKRKAEEETRRKAEEERKKREAEAAVKAAKAETERLKREEETKKAAEEQLKKDALEKKKQDELVKQEELKKQAEAQAKKGKGITSFSTITIKFENFQKKITSFKTDIVQPVSKDIQLRQMSTQLKRKINPKFGQLTNSMKQLNSISQALVDIISETRQNELMFKWTMNYTAKKLISQSETEVRARPAAALPLAHLTLSLMCSFPELKEYLLARFIKKCPLLIGFHRPIDQGATESEHAMLGWRKVDDKWESLESHNERLAGIATLFFTVTRLPLSQPFFQTTKHPLSLTNAWVFIARVLNLPLDHVDSTVLSIAGAWWEACAREVSWNYGKQANKILSLVSGEWCEVVARDGTPAVKAGAGVLQTMGEGELKGFPEMEY